MEIVGIVRKEASFDAYWGDGWPDAKAVEHCLSDPRRRAQYFADGYDGGCFAIEGYEDEKLIPISPYKGAVLYMHMNPEHGIKLQHSSWDKRLGERNTYHSKGDLRRLKEFVRSFHGTQLSVGLFVPFDAGCKAVMEFMQTDGELPRNISWISEKDLPADVFPDP